MSPRKLITGMLVFFVASFTFVGIAGAHETDQAHAAEHALLDAIDTGTETPELTSEPVPVLISENPETTSTLSELEQRNALLEQIQVLVLIVEQLQAQLATMNANGGVISTEFTNNLSIGSKGFEVKALQEMLNTDKRTQVASSGDGSPGRETDYFGALTAKAVSKFQELYRSEILTPNDLVRGNGFFGPSTRKKMNALIKARVASTIAGTPSNNQNESQDQVQGQNIDTNTTNTQPLSQNSSQNLENSLNSGGNTLSDISVLSIDYEVYEGFAVGEASFYAGAPGESITITGNKLSNTTRINFGDTKSVTGLASPDGKSLTFTVPNIAKGPYELTFESGSGEDALRIMDFTITFSNATAPEVFSVSPSIGPEGTLVTIFGKGFTATNNQVEFGQNIVTGIPSLDGRSIKVNVFANIDLPSASETASLSYAEWPVFIYVANANGRALEPSIFIIKN